MLPFQDADNNLIDSLKGSSDMPAKRPRLLYLALQDPHVPVNGTCLRGGEMLRRLSQEFETDLVYMEGAGQPPMPYGEEALKNLPHLRERVKVPFSPSAYFLFSRSFLTVARSLLEMRKHDFILCDYGICALYGLILSRKAGVRFIYGSHNLEYRGNLNKSREDFRRLPLALYMYIVERLGVQRANIVIAITESDANAYSNWTDPAKIVVIPQGIDESIFNPHYEAPHNQRKIVLFCGNFKSQFNRNAVAEVKRRIADYVVARIPGVRFRFVGAYPPVDIQHPSFEYTGFADDYVDQLKAADVVISPILQGQGFPTKIIEALAVGKIVISTPVGARGVDPGLSSLRIQPIEAFPQAIVEALTQGHGVQTTDFERIRALYSWDALVARLLNRMRG